jgi:hypothetical protein
LEASSQSARHSGSSASSPSVVDTSSSFICSSAATPRPLPMISGFEFGGEKSFPRVTALRLPGYGATTYSLMPPRIGCARSRGCGQLGQKRRCEEKGRRAILD